MSEGVDEGEGAPQAELADQGGEAACLASRLCPECGAVLGEDRHRPGCPVPQGPAPG